MSKVSYEIAIEDYIALRQIVISINNCFNIEIDNSYKELIKFSKAIGAPIYMMDEELPEEKEVEEKK